MKRKRTHEAHVVFTLRDIPIPANTWMPEFPGKKRIYMSARVSVGMPPGMRRAVEEASSASGLSMSEAMRRCFAKQATEGVNVR
jgi:hypothetical protein